MNAGQTRIRVVIADDHPLILTALRDLFHAEGDIDVVASCRDGRDVVPTVRTHHPDVLLLDVSLPGLTGLDILRMLRHEKHPAHVVLLTAALSEDDLLEAARLGVNGVVLKDLAPELLVQCVRKVHAGEQWLERRSIARAFDTLLRREAGTREVARTLTARELEIMRLAARGIRNREIADQLHVTEGTVKIHMHNIYEKLGVRNRSELTLYARDRGLV